MTKRITERRMTMDWLNIWAMTQVIGYGIGAVLAVLLIGWFIYDTIKNN